MEEGVGYELVEFGDFLQGEFGVVVDGWQVFLFNSSSFIGWWHFNGTSMLVGCENQKFKKKTPTKIKCEFNWTNYSLFLSFEDSVLSCFVSFPWFSLQLCWFFFVSRVLRGATFDFFQFQIYLAPLNIFFFMPRVFSFLLSSPHRPSSLSHRSLP